jgi:cytochrome c6
VKRLWIAICALLTLIPLFVGMPAFAADLDNGAKIFGSNCAACHMGGGNVVNGAKTLSKDDLEKWGMNSIDAITTQVTNGKLAMPAFKGRLSDTDIQDVAAYVLEQSNQGW